MRRVAGFVVPLLLLLTAACGGGGDSDTPKPTPGTLADVTVSGPADQKPVVDFKAPISFASTESKVIDKGLGTGAAVSADSVVTVDYVAINASDDNEFDSSWGKGKPPTFALDQVIKGFTEGLTGDHAGDRVLITITSKDGYDPVGNGSSIHKGDSLIFVVDIHRVSNPLKSATGTPMSAPATVPSLTLDDKGVPTGFKTTPTTPKTPTDLGIYPLIKGKGPVVKKGQTIVVNYLGQLYPDGKVFDESYSTNDPATFQIGAGQVIPGWDDGLVGQTVGSRVVLVIPSAQGYGKTGKSPAIPPDADLIFSVDILQAY